MKQALIEMKGISKKYFIGKPNELEVLHNIHLTIYQGEFVAIIGESGSGKSTLMNIIGALDSPTTGHYVLNNMAIETSSDADLAKIRNKEIGFVFQTFNLIGRSTAIKNVELPMLYARVKSSVRHERALHLLELVGMKDRMKHLPSELSGGQKQRVAIARALSNHPSIILADEPTGALDSETSRHVMDLFHQLHQEEKATIILITHNPELAKECERIITIKDGYIIDDTLGEA